MKYTHSDYIIYYVYNTSVLIFFVKQISFCTNYKLACWLFFPSLFLYNNFIFILLCELCTFPKSSWEIVGALGVHAPNMWNARGDVWDLVEHAPRFVGTCEHVYDTRLSIWLSVWGAWQRVIHVLNFWGAHGVAWTCAIHAPIFGGWRGAW